MRSSAMRSTIIQTSLVAVSALVAIAVVRIVTAYAGSLTPSAAPAATMKTLTEVYDPIAGTSYTSTVTASSSGDILQLTKCAVTKLQGGTCT